VAVNGFHGDFPHAVSDVQDALSVSPHVPVIQCDARERRSTESTLISLVEHAMQERHQAICNPAVRVGGSRS
jgi:uncharacterized protein